MTRTTPQPVSLTIRDATEADLPRLIEMGSAFLHATAWGGRVADDADHFRALALSLMATGSMVVAVEQDAVIGMLGAMVFTHPVTNQPIGAEVILWVEPDARRTGAGEALFHAAETWAHAQGATAMQFSAYRDPVLERWYRRLGYHAQEVVFQKELM